MSESLSTRRIAPRSTASGTAREKVPLPTNTAPTVRFATGVRSESEPRSAAPPWHPAAGRSPSRRPRDRSGERRAAARRTPARSRLPEGTAGGPWTDYQDGHKRIWWPADMAPSRGTGWVKPASHLSPPPVPLQRVPPMDRLNSQPSAQQVGTAPVASRATPATPESPGAGRPAAPGRTRRSPP
jgi:hypothetical protein